MINIKKISTLLMVILISSCASNNLYNRNPAGNNPFEYRFLGDIEGNYEKLLKYIEESDVLYFRDGELHIKGDAKFVFIGDPIDKGEGSIRILDILNDLKNRYPDQYIQIAGNRDLNKMRLPNELSDRAMKRAPRDPKTQDEEIRWKRYREWLTDRPDNKPNRLKFIFDKTMGADRAFDFRRKEIAILQNINITSIGDEAVLDSFLSDFSPNGRMTTYIRNSQMLHLTDDGTLMAHGYIGEKNFGYIPFKESDSFKVPKSPEEVENWVDEVNKSTKRLINLWETELSGERLRSDSEWMDLVRFQEPLPNSNGNDLSFIYGRYSDESGNPQLPSRNFMERTNEANLKRIVVGHTPTGDYAVVLTDPITGLKIGLIDTSASKEKAPQITINENGLKIKGTISGIGEIITDEGPYMGSKTFDDFHVIGRKINSDEYILHKIDTIDNRPFTSSYEKVSLTKLKQRLKLKNSRKSICFELIEKLLTF